MNRMSRTLYDRKHATALLPLLHSIAGEIRERTCELEHVEALLAQAEAGERPRADVHDLVARAAHERRELRHARAELERLGCTIVGTAPITIRIPGQRGSRKQSFVYQTGDVVLR
jgi:hypothetical protein